MIHHIPPALDDARIEQMIHTAMSFKQDKRKNIWADFTHRMTPTIRYGLGFGATLAMASILGIMWLGPVKPTNTHATTTVAYDDDTSDILLYNLLTDLS